MRDIRQTPQYANYLKNIGWIVEQKNDVCYFIKKLPLIGSVVKIQRPHIPGYKDIEDLSKKYRIFQIIIEPKDTTNSQWLMANEFKLSKSPYLPTKTLRLDLTLPMNRLIGSMKKDTRQAIKKTESLKIEEAKNLEEFVKGWRKAVGWKRHVPSIKELEALKKSFGKNCVVFQCLHNTYASSVRKTLKQEPVAGGIFLMGDKIGYYWQAFTNKEGRGILAQYRIVWGGVLWAKKHGAKIFDFEGIYDERVPNKKWLGFTHFKKSFGGDVVEYPGCFVKINFRNIIGL